MINETLEVKEYLEGNKINKKCLYRICYMLAKWHNQQGLSHLEIRQYIFEWGEKYNIFIPFNLNNVIYQVIEDKSKLRENVDIKINDNDINEITKRFDSKNCRLLALGLLCLAKCSANKDNEFNVSLLSLSEWLHINHGNLSAIYLPELIDFGYISKVNTEKTFSWDKKVKSKSLTLKINVPIHNNGKYVINDNDIQQLYDSIFDF